MQMFSVVCYSCCAKCELLKVSEVLSRWCTDADWCYGVALPDFNCMWIWSVSERQGTAREMLSVSGTSVVIHFLLTNEPFSYLSAR